MNLSKPCINVKICDFFFKNHLIFLNDVVSVQKHVTLVRQSVTSVCNFLVCLFIPPLMPVPQYSFSHTWGCKELPFRCLLGCVMRVSLERCLEAAGWSLGVGVGGWVPSASQVLPNFSLEWLQQLTLHARQNNGFPEVSTSRAPKPVTEN